MYIVCFVFCQFLLAQTTHNTFKTNVQTKYEYQYALHKPEGETKKPLLIFLHGSGEKGTDVELVKVHGPFKYIKTHE